MTNPDDDKMNRLANESWFKHIYAPFGFIECLATIVKLVLLPDLKNLKELKLT